MRPPLTRRLAPFGTSIFAEMTALAHEHDALNLGQGFPDFDGPDFVMDAAVVAMKAGHNQYAPMPGVPELRRAIADHQQYFYGLEYDPATEITVHAGATGALCATLQALLDPGDEVVLFEPFYDAYRPGISLSGAGERVVRLVPPGFTFEPAELAAAVGPNTRLLLLNSPNNPAGKVFTRRELETIADICLRHDLIAVTDDVYEHIVFEGQHIPLATLPGMRERTVTISSAGKTFSFTGWKIGWTCAAPPLAAAVRAAHQFVTYAVATPFQHAMAAALGAGDDYYDELREGYRARRDRLCAGLADIGFVVEPPSGTYFANADIRPLGFDDDVAFCRELPGRVGVAAVPLSAFTLEGDPRHMVRFAFAKDLATLDEAVRRLRRLNG
jgi:N-succinyldiaminopimelate aminotransferase